VPSLEGGKEFGSKVGPSSSFCVVVRSPRPFSTPILSYLGGVLDVMIVGPQSTKGVGTHDAR
jgi:hypothetical protein